MRLHGAALLCFIYIHQVIGSGRSITAYQGQSVVLKSGVESSEISSASWSIYNNGTHIASLRKGNIIYYDFWRHQGRLELNKTTGDLTIKNLAITDSMIYTLDLSYKNGSQGEIKYHLTVQEQFKTPYIQELLQSFKDGQCHVALNCATSGRDVALSWTPSADFNGSYISGSSNSSAIVFISFSSKVNVMFNCTASSDKQMETIQIEVGCLENHSKVCKTCTSFKSSGSCVVCIVGLALLLFIALVYAYKHRVQIKDLISNFNLPSIPQRRR